MYPARPVYFFRSEGVSHRVLSVKTLILILILMCVSPCTILCIEGALACPMWPFIIFKVWPYHYVFFFTEVSKTTTAVTQLRDAHRRHRTEAMHLDRLLVEVEVLLTEISTWYEKAALPHVAKQQNRRRSDVGNALRFALLCLLCFALFALLCSFFFALLWVSLVCFALLCSLGCFLFRAAFAAFQSSLLIARKEPLRGAISRLPDGSREPTISFL